MERVSISLDDDLLVKFDGYMQRKGYANRSEAIRDLLRERLERDQERKEAATHSVGCLSYVYNHHQRELARRLTEAQHAHHSYVLSTLHVHLDHENCLEVVVLNGETESLRSFAEATIAETGVRHGRLHLIATEMVESQHKHGHGAKHGHTHAKPLT
ncbi:MAG TPA: nickel-responsive transcriptional regulator NikR [Alphaproteobacteria bacterium]|jgi:CopG family nickel-responsive transcriptional regulator